MTQDREGVAFNRSIPEVHQFDIHFALIYGSFLATEHLEPLIDIANVICL